MAQGLGSGAGRKLSKTKSAKSGGSQKRKRATKKAKGRKYHAPKGRKAIQQRAELETTKAINRKNESLISARAVGNGTRFFLSDVKEAGQKELKAQVQARNKKQDKATKVADRVKEQLRKMGRDV